jgi:hypothetical protein
MDHYQELIRLNKTYKGACFCGQLKFEFDGPSLWCAHCHCTMCRQTHGAAFVTWVGVAEDNFRLTDESTLKWFESSENARRGFCSQCGSSVFFNSTQWPGEIHIARAAIAGEIDRQPQVHVFWDSHVDWASVDDKLPIKEIG